jgi:transposase
MANRPAPALGLRDGDRAELARLTRSSSARAGLTQRARIVLLAADGESNTAIAAKVGVSRPTVIGWRNRYAAHGIAGLDEEPRSGRPRTIDHRQIVAQTLRPPPKKYGVTHWSSRLLGRHLGISNGTVAKAWRDYGVAPWRVETFKFSTDPELVAKVTDVVGLYLAPPENAIVLCVDEKSQIQALDRTAPMLPMQPGLPERRTHDYRATAPRRCSPRWKSPPASHRRVQAAPPASGVPAFLKQVARHAYPTVELHLVMDNYAAHKRVEVRDWLAANPRIHGPLHPDLGLLAEPGRGLVRHHRAPGHPPRHLQSVKDLNAKIRAFVDGWNDRCHPFVWTKTADEILKKANRQTTSNTGH